VLETGSPNKFFDGLAAGKLIIINFGGWIKNEIENHLCGVYVNPNQPADFTKKVIPFLSDKKLLENYQQASRKLAEKHYSRNLLSIRYTGIFK
jgi:glycosyltransferase involved in cell wall biosynthesis